MEHMMKTHRVFLFLAAWLLLHSCSTPPPASVTPGTEANGLTVTQTAATPPTPPVEMPAASGVNGGLIALTLRNENGKLQILSSAFSIPK
jgi:hypothetical protein